MKIKHPAETNTMDEAILYLASIGVKVRREKMREILRNHPNIATREGHVQGVRYIFTPQDFDEIIRIRTGLDADLYATQCGRNRTRGDGPPTPAAAPTTQERDQKEEQERDPDSESEEAADDERPEIQAGDWMPPRAAPDAGPVLETWARRDPATGREMECAARDPGAYTMTWTRLLGTDEVAVEMMRPGPVPTERIALRCAAYTMRGGILVPLVYMGDTIEAANSPDEIPYGGPSSHGMPWPDLLEYATTMWPDATWLVFKDPARGYQPPTSDNAQPTAPAAAP